MEIDMPPGSVVVVGPRGRLYLNTDNSTRWKMINCTCISPESLSKNGKELVAEVWGERTEFGDLVDSIQKAELQIPPDLASKFAEPAAQKAEKHRPLAEMAKDAEAAVDEVIERREKLALKAFGLGWVCSIVFVILAKIALSYIL